ncbi:MAG: hypothetical protein J6A25_05920 [Lachnospiraceae bacterium]|nr:hypothetical protein [Lachnospiraceae bacterium]
MPKIIVIIKLTDNWVSAESLEPWSQDYNNSSRNGVIITMISNHNNYES